MAITPEFNRRPRFAGPESPGGDRAGIVRARSLARIARAESPDVNRGRRMATEENRRGRFGGAG